MENSQNVIPIGTLAGKSVLSLQTGNRIGTLRDVIIDPVNGVVMGIMVSGLGNEDLCLPYESIYSFGHDAVMAVSETALCPPESAGFGGYPFASNLIGTKLITVSGNLLGQIRNVLVTIHPPPVVIYSLGDSLLDKLLGREMFLEASSAYVFSDDGERLVVPDDAGEKAARSVDELIDPLLAETAFEPSERPSDRDDTFVLPHDPDAEIGSAQNEGEFETIIRSDDDDTVIRLRPDTASEGRG